jgi:D-serine deaminase-like pyridoxal phosphate-dependent protein
MILEIQKMKTLAFAALSVLTVMASANVLADEQSSAQPLTQVEQYNRHKGIDVARVTSVKTAQDPEKVDGLVKSTMTYVDGSGVTHSLEYTTMGYGRQNG